jgi:putative nucleotidyltransferase with HDIG domain
MRQDYVKVSENIIGCFLGDDVYNTRGNMIVPVDTFITEHIVKKLQKFKIEKVFIYGANAIHGDSYLQDTTINEVQKKFITDVNVAKNMIKELSAGRELDIEKVEDISEHIYTKVNEGNSLLDCINSIKVADEYTYAHLINVAVYSVLLAKWMGLNDLQMKEVAMAGLLHDVGKTQIPPEILNKRGPLSDEEFEIMKGHAILSYQIIKNNTEISMEVKRAVIMHHEKEDGTGYPFGIKGSQKNLYSKIITVADIFDAITSEKVYKQRQTPFEAFKEMEKIGYDTVDPKVMVTLLNNMPNCFIGSKVKMENGDIGEVVYVPNQCAYAPVIKVNNIFFDFKYEKEALIKEFL